MSLGPAEIGLIVLAVMLLFKSEVEELEDDGSTTPSSAGGGSRTPTPEGTRS